MGQVVQLVGAVLVVGAFMAAQRKRIRYDSVQFLALNTVGAGILTVVAAVNRDYGFLLLEFVWTWVAARGLRKAVSQARAEQAAKRSGRSKRGGSGPLGRRRRRRNHIRPV